VNGHTQSGKYRRDDDQVQEIRRRMAALRRELQGDVEQVGESAQAVSNWRYYVRRYPWVAVAAAAAVGYLVVPQKAFVVTPDPEDLAKLARRERIIVSNKPEKASAGWLGALATLAMTGAMRAAMAYVGEQFGAATAGTTAPKSPAPRTNIPTPGGHA
jgi:hypothetical protein